jgi:drug/metabolite transporter (DMT)-like permease
LLAVSLALAASLCWGLGDFVGGLTSRKLAVLIVLPLTQLTGFVTVLVFIAFHGDRLPPAHAALAAALAGLAGAVGLGALYRGMAVGAMGVVAPISSIAAVVPVAYGIARGERPSVWQFGGVALALCGVALASREPGAERGLAAGVGLALVAAAGFGGFFVGIDLAAGDGGVAWSIAIARGTATVVAIAAALAARTRLRLERRHIPAILFVGVADMGANAFFATATTEGLVSVVSVLASLYPVVTVAAAFVVLRERVGRAQLVGIAAALTGIALISGG